MTGPAARPLVIGVDPGPTPGIALVRPDGTPELVQCTGSLLLDVVLRALVETGPRIRTGLDDADQPHVILAAEAYVVGPKSAKVSSRGANEQTRRMVGALEALAAELGIIFRARPAATVKTWATTGTPSRVERAGLAPKGMVHARSAGWHALYCAVNDAGHPDPLSKPGVPLMLAVVPPRVAPTAPAPPRTPHMTRSPEVTPEVTDAAFVEAYWTDCLDRLRALPAASVHAVITDPPYGLADHKPATIAATLGAWATGDRERVPDGKGFMGRAWDAFVPPPAVWDECLRVLVPGGALAVFAGTRTVDLMGLSIRLAGFEMRDGIAAWLYGCLTDDAEILTEQGWRPGVEVERGDRVAQWDPATGSISLAAVEEVFRAPWDGPMRVLRNVDTDQVLTPNHRVWHNTRRRQMIDGVRHSWYEDGWDVRPASALNTYDPVRLPVAGEHDGPGIGGPDYAALLGWVWTEGGFDHSGTGVRIYQSSVNPEKVAEIDALLDRLGPHKRYDRERTYRNRSYVETMWFLSGDLAQRVRADLPGKRPTYDLLWRMTAVEKRALRDAALLGDGHVDQRGTWQFYQRHEDDLVWFATLLSLVGQAGKVGMRPDRDNGTVYVRDRATTELQARHLRDDREHYQGEVWCVRVPTSAFVARRNGRVFITGNSGFPKSRRVSADIDRTLGATRERVPQTSGIASGMGDGRYVGASRDHSDSAPLAGTRADDTCLTDAAHEWEGWGTALKPAHEPILLARKPLSGTVAANVQAHRAGALNIDACRVAHGSDVDLTRRQNQHADTAGMNGLGESGFKADHSQALYAEGGRWPTNVVLAHHPDCGPVEAPGPCVDGCQVAALDAQSGTLTSGAGNTRRQAHHTGSMSGTLGQLDREEVSYGDSGGASRFFPTFRYTAKAPKRERPTAWGGPEQCRCAVPRPLDPETGALPPRWRAGTVCAGCERPATHRGHPTVKPLDLMRWLVRLLVVDGGTVLDPFSGSGSTLEAARLEGVHAIGCEADAHSVRLIATRLGLPDPWPCVAPLLHPERVPDPFAELETEVWAAADAAEIARLRLRPAWAPEHDALAALRLSYLDEAPRDEPKTTAGAA